VDPDYWKGEVFAYVGLPQNLKDLQDLALPQDPSSPEVGVRIVGLRRREFRERLVACPR
jgi:hypothetical protein